MNAVRYNNTHEPQPRFINALLPQSAPGRLAVETAGNGLTKNKRSRRRGVVCGRM